MYFYMKIYIETLGCPKNFYDTEIATGILERAGHKLVSDWTESDLIMVNTCGFINDAKKESIMKIFEFADRGDRILVVSGCLSKRYADELIKEMPEVDIFIGVNEYEKLPEIIAGHIKGKHEKFVEEYSKDPDPGYRNCNGAGYSATLKISEGCDNRCAYCVIPDIRGPYRSRSMESIVEEAEKLADAGVKELILIGQDVTAYGKDIYGAFNLHELLRKLCRVDGIRWIRLMYSYEDRITDELINVMAQEEKVCRYIDMPLQHSSDHVLKMMRRRSTAESIKNTIKRLRKAIPDIAIRTTLITGFPGETEEEFDNLYDFVQETGFQRLGVFTYSAEEGTPAAEMEDQIDEEIKEERKDSIMRLQMEISRQFNESLVGRKMEVLIEEKDEEGVYLGRTQYDAPEIDNCVIVRTDKDHEPGDFINIEVTDAYDYDIVGREI